MDPSTKVYLTKLRVKELHAILRALGLSTQGLKHQLVSKIEGYLHDNSDGSARAVKNRREAKNIIQRIYEDYTGTKFPESPPAPANNDSMRRQKNVAATTATNNDYYPQGPAPFVPARNNGEVAAGPSTAGHHRNTAQRLQRPAPVASRAGGTANIGANIMCPCATQVFSDPKELVVCQTCKRAGRHKLQHASHMGYTAGSITAADREKYMCDKCRITYADPFWRDSTAAGLNDAWLLPFTFVPAHRSSIPSRDPRISLDRTIQFPRDLLQMRSSPNLSLQALCIATTDGPPPKPPPSNGAHPPPPQRAAPQHRLHWPPRSELHLGLGSPARHTTRSSKIGINGRDAPVNVMPHVSSTGMLKIVLHGNGEPSQYLFGLRIAEPRPLQEVVAMMAPQETAEAAVQRVSAAVGGGSRGNADDDDDDILHAETLPLSLRDPMSNTRIRRAARILGAKSPRAFDLDYFLDSAKRSRKWQCPITLQNVLVTEVMPDVYVNAVLYALRERPAVTDVVLGRDGRWRVSESEPWQDIRTSPQEALQLAAAPCSEPAPPIAPTAVVDAPPPPKPSPVAAGRAAVNGGAAIEILSSSDDDVPPPPPQEGTGGGPGSGSRAAQPPPKRPRTQAAGSGAGAAIHGGMSLAPQLGGQYGTPTSHPQPQLFVPHGVPMRGGAPGPPPGQAGHPVGVQARSNIHHQNMPGPPRRNGYAFR
eukprot:jgi/Ulvmu1/3917/UM018_0140.1